MNGIIGVHGIGNYDYYRRNRSVADATAAISADWTSWLTAGLPELRPIDLTVAYYAHHLHRGTPQGAEDDPALLEPGAQDLLVAWVEQLQPRPQVALGPRTAWARQAAEWITREYGRAVCKIAVRFVREVHTYLHQPNSERRVAAREEVAETIATHRPRVIIAHSLGSVVAYEALWAHPKHDVDLLVTLGSPLGMHEVVFDQLQPAPAGRGSRPPRVEHWANLADIGDIIAIPRDLQERFDGIGIHKPDLCIGTWEFHKVCNYLACPQTVEVLLPHLAPNPGA